MAEKSKSKKEKKIESSSEEEEEEYEDENESPSPVENKFANDGSFLELFRQKMAEQEKDDGKDKSSAQIPAPHTETEDGETQLKAYQAGVGKRKTLLKTNRLRELRKRRREEIEEHRKVEEEDGNQSKAWKTYMKEVRELQEKCCTEKDDHKRPLVK